MIFPWLFILAVLFFIAVAIWWRQSGPRYRRQIAGGGQPVCGKCGYSMIGLHGMTCPECGSDLRRVGIEFAGESHRRPGALGTVAIFTTAVTFAAIAVTPLLVAMLPLWHSYTAHTTLASPSSGRYSKIDVSADGGSWDERRVNLPVVITLQLNPLPSGPAPFSTMILDAERGSFQYGDASGKRITMPSGFEFGAILKWMQSNGINTGDAQVEAEARRVAIAAQKAARVAVIFGPGARSSTRGPQSTTSFSREFQTRSGNALQPLLALKLMIAGWAALWLVGMGSILHQRRRIASPGN